ncbi:TVP38/TMEM64 family protein [Halobacteriaceae archaeon GCM10025711]
MRVFSSPAGRRDFLFRSAVVVLLLAGALTVTHRYLPAVTDPVFVRDVILGFGPLAPAAFVVVQAVQVVVAPIPGQVLAVVGGYLFGAVAGWFYSMVGVTIGTYVAVRLSQLFGRPYVERVLDAAFVRRWDDVVDENGVVAIFLLFLIPGMPDDAICFLCGLTRIPAWKLVLLSLVGRTPGFFLATLAGSSIYRSHYWEAALILGVLAALSVAVYLKRDALWRFLRVR